MMNAFTMILNRLKTPGFFLPIGTDRSVLLTIDDGPNEKTQALLNWLHEENISALHFWTAKYYQNLKSELSIPSSQKIAVHGYNHVRYANLSQKEVAAELDLIDRSGMLQTSSALPYFRPPYGSYRPGLHNLLKTRSFIPLYWGWLFPDWTPEFIPDSIRNSARFWCKPGMILVLHDKLQYHNRLKTTILNIREEMVSKGLLFGYGLH